MKILLTVILMAITFTEAQYYSFYGYGATVAYSTSSSRSISSSTSSSNSITEEWQEIKQSATTAGTASTTVTTTYFSPWNYYQSIDAKGEAASINDKIRAATADTTTATRASGLSIAVHDHDFMAIRRDSAGILFTQSAPVSWSPTADILLCQELDSTGAAQDFFLIDFRPEKPVLSEAFGPRWSVSSVWSVDGALLQISHSTLFESKEKAPEIFVVDSILAAIGGKND